MIRVWEQLVKIYDPFIGTWWFSCKHNDTNLLGKFQAAVKIVTYLFLNFLMTNVPVIYRTQSTNFVK